MFRKSSRSKVVKKSDIVVIRSSSLLAPDSYWDFLTLTCPVAISLHPTNGLLAILCTFGQVRIYTVDGYFVTKVRLRNARRRGVSFRVVSAGISFSDNVLISQAFGATIYHSTDQGTRELSLPIQYYDSDSNDNAYATCDNTGNIQIFSSSLDYKQEFPGYHGLEGTTVRDMKVEGDCLVVEVRDCVIANSFSILFYCISTEQLIRTFSPDFFQTQFRFCIDESLNILIHNSYGNKLIMCLYARNPHISNYIISEESFSNRNRTISRGSVSRHVLRAVRMNGENQLIRCFSSGAVRVSQFNSLKRQYSIQMDLLCKYEFNTCL